MHRPPLPDDVHEALAIPDGRPALPPGVMAAVEAGVKAALDLP